MKTLYLEDYEITKEGLVINKHNGRVVKPQKNGKGYFRVSIGGKLKFVHRLVAEQFIPNPNNLPQVNHIDGDKTNNCVDNLEWVTNGQNRKHAIENNLQICGEDCKNSVLTEKDVYFIYKNQHLKGTELARILGKKRQTINNVLQGKTWKKQMKRYAELSQIESDRNKG